MDLYKQIDMGMFFLQLDKKVAELGECAKFEEDAEAFIFIFIFLVKWGILLLL